MTIQTFSLPVIPVLTEKSGRVFNPVSKSTRDHFRIGQAEDIPAWCARVTGNEGHGFNSPRGDEWSNYMNVKDAKDCTAKGHMPSVAASDRFLAQIEDILPAPTGRHVMIDDVVGAVPNVPAYLAGTPLTMRRRVKRLDECSPIGIVVDTVASAQVTNKQMLNRGAAVLALVRALATRRPVELWIGAGLNATASDGSRRDAQWTFFQLDTAPLDIARAAFYLAHPAFTRGIQYAMGEIQQGFTGQWPYGLSSTFGQDFGREIVGRAMPHLEDMIWVPGAHISDPTVSDPIAWVRANVAAYSGEEKLDDAA